MGITALSVANIATPGNLRTSTPGTPADGLLSAALPAEFAALLAQFSGNQPLASPPVDAKKTPLLTTEAGPAADDTQLASAPLNPDELGQLMQQAQPYLPSTQEKAGRDGVDRSKLVDDSTPTADPALLAALALNPASAPPAGQAPLGPEAAPEAAPDNLLLASSLAGLAGSAQTQANPAPTSPLPNSQNTLELTSSTRETLPWQLSTANIAGDAAPTTPSGSHFAAALSAAQSAPTQTPASSAADIPTPLHDRQWGQNFSEKIVWLAKADQQVAQININPPQLGPVQINLNINGDQASAVFTSAHAEVRQAIEDALPRLREMLSSAGISLGQANVGAQLPQQNRDTPPQFANGTRFSNETAILPGDSDPAPSAVALQRGRGLVDLFA